MEEILIRKLIEKGVEIPVPDQIFIEKSVVVDRIASGVVLHPGTRLYGEKTFLHRGSVLGEEGPVVLENVLTGKNVRLKGGFFQEAVFLEGASAGSGSHVRGGTILEEGASLAHTVGLKQTILFPWVTLGSLINFCDILMSGGTNPRNHSEVGSSYIHFNFTPDQDKATPSLLGDVPSGVMLDQEPIFLGGQGGLVGPCRLSFGTVIAAGTMQRKDEKRKNRLIFGDHLTRGNIEKKVGAYPSLKRILENNFFFLANLHALKSWYTYFRKLFVSDDFPEELLSGLLLQVRACMNERISRLSQLCKKVEGNPLFFPMEKTSIHKKWIGRADEILSFLSSEIENVETPRIENLKENFLQDLPLGKTALETIQVLSEEKKDLGRKWLSAIVTFYHQESMNILNRTPWAIAMTKTGMNGNFFGTDGVRGKAGVPPMDAETMLRMGFSYGKWLLKNHPDVKNPMIVLGKDTRESCDMLASALASGLMRAGIDIVDMDVQPTPAVAITVRDSQAIGGAMISASHNPFYDNGVKFFKHDGLKLKDAEEEAVSLIMESSSDFVPGHFGKTLSNQKFIGIYKNFILEKALSGEDLKGLRIVLDTANGAVYRTAPEFFRNFGAEIRVIADEPDGRNINDGVGSQHVEKLGKAVLDWGADLGLAFDGDGDRLIAVDGKGNKVRGDSLLAIFGKAAREKSKESTVIVSTVMSNLGLKEFFAAQDIRHETSSVGDRQVLEKMFETGAKIGGEDSGHFIFLDPHCSGDGIFAGLRLAALCKKRPLEELAGGLRFYPQVLINVPMKKRIPLEEFPEIQKRILEAEDEFRDSGRVLIRYSGTEPLCRVMVEAASKDLAEKHCKAIASALGKLEGI